MATRAPRRTIPLRRTDRPSWKERRHGLCGNPPWLLRAPFSVTLQDRTSAIEPWTRDLPGRQPGVVRSAHESGPACRTAEQESQKGVTRRAEARQWPEAQKGP